MVSAKDKPKGGAVGRRHRIREEFWPEVRAWEGPGEVGYFCAPRSLPFILQALSEKAVSSDKDPSMVYVELLSRHLGQGVIEMTHEEDHSFAAGYRGNRTWKDRMKVLEDAGFIRTSSTGRKYAKVLLVHPSVAMKALHDAGKIPDRLWTAYRDRQIEAGELSVPELSPPSAASPSAGQPAFGAAKARPIQ